MADNNTPMHEHPQYLHGQALALRALILALASITTDPEVFRERGLQGLERLRTVLLPEPVSDAQLAGLDATEQWLRAST